MRSSRFIAILVALVFAAVVPMAAAQATTGATAKARTSHVVKGLDAGEIRNTGKFYVKGQAVTYKNKLVKLHKRTCKKCAWKPFKQDRSSGTGHFRINFDGPRGTCYRLFIPGTAKYKPFYAPVGCIVAG